MHKKSKRPASKTMELEIPTRKHEEFRFTDLSFLKNHSFEKATLERVTTPIRENHVLVFVNGIWSKNLSRLKGIDIEESTISEEENFISALNKTGATACHSFIIKNNVDLHIMHIVTKGSIRATPRYHLSIQKGLSVNLLESFRDETSKQYLYVPVMYLDINKGAQVTHVQLQEQNPSSFHLGRTISEVHESANYTSFVAGRTGLLSRREIHINLGEIHATANLYGLYTLRENQHCAHYSTIHHKTKDTKSHTQYHGILDNQSHGVFRGRIIVDKKAQNIESKQINNNLLLGKEAKVNSLPQLEIAADDVSCGHGSTIGQINPEELFYLQSRGIPREKAIALICKGFCFELIHKLNKTAQQFLEETL